MAKCWIALVLCLGAVFVSGATGRSPDKRQVLTDRSRLWPDRKIKVAFAEAKYRSPLHLNQELKKMMTSAGVFFRAVHRKTCLRPTIIDEQEVARLPADEKYVLYIIEPRSNDCYVRQTGIDEKHHADEDNRTYKRFLPEAFQHTTFDIIVMGALNLDCQSYYGVAHEFLHQLGLDHEQSRPDRDDHIRVNIHPAHNQPNQYNKCENCTDATEYDPLSIMHYPPNIFGGQQDITRLNGKGSSNQMGRGQDLSLSDWFRINEIYCKDDCSANPIDCGHGGYQNPNNCSQCFCADGIGQGTCGDHPQPDFDCGGLLYANNSWDHENYMTPLDQTHPRECKWVIQAPPGETVLLKFTSVPVPGESRIPCKTQSVEVRFGRNMQKAESLECDMKTLFRYYRSEGDRLMVIHRWNQHFEPATIDFAFTIYRPEKAETDLFEEWIGDLIDLGY